MCRVLAGWLVGWLVGVTCGSTEFMVGGKERGVGYLLTNVGR